MKSLMLFAALALGACAIGHDEHLEGAHYDSGLREVVLRSGVEYKFGRVMVGIGDVFERKFFDAQGHSVEGNGVTLYFDAPDEIESRIVVGEGGSFEMGGTKWRVSKLMPSPRGGAIVERVGS